MVAPIAWWYVHRVDTDRVLLASHRRLYSVLAGWPAAGAHEVMSQWQESRDRPAPTGFGPCDDYCGSSRRGTMSPNGPVAGPFNSEATSNSVVKLLRARKRFEVV